MYRSSIRSGRLSTRSAFSRVSQSNFKLIRLQNRHLNIETRPPPNSHNTGQPTHETRPHYLPTPGNLTPGISALEYYTRRLELMKDLPPRSLVILQGNQVKYSSGAVFYDFQQDNDLYYLTGWLEPDTVAIIEKSGPSGDDVVLHMLVPPKNPHTELWEGEKSGLQGAYDYFNADFVEDINKAARYIESLVSKNDKIFWDDRSGSKNGGGKFGSFFSLPSTSTREATLQGIITKSKKDKAPLAPMVAKLRSVKSESEIRVLQAAAQISSRAINKAIARVGSSAPFYTEKTLAKYLEYEFVKGGCDKQAYIPVVASGKNALTIHYTRNDDVLYRDEMVFVDAGGKLGGYCADISRTWPNSPKGFSDPQKDIYQVVLETNRKCIDLCSESSGVSLHDIHEFSVNSLSQGLRNLPGFSALNSNDMSRTLYPHYIGHHLGLDLHDIPSVSRFQKLVAGNVITIEPGLYIPQADKWPKHYQGIGVRVEDDIVIGKTEKFTTNLSSGCIKEIEDIEALIRKGEVTTPGAHEELVILDI